MVLPLIAIAAALLAKQQEDRAQKVAAMHEVDKDENATLAAIRAQRASRAGDMGYMQTAARGMTGYPVPQPMQSGKMIAEVGKALMSQKEAPSAPSAIQAPQLRDNEDSAYKSTFGDSGTYVNKGSFTGVDVPDSATRTLQDDYNPDEESFLA
jgi:hypothetical protein